MESHVRAARAAEPEPTRMMDRGWEEGGAGEDIVVGGIRC